MKVIGVGVMGFGTVGAGVVEGLLEQADLITKRTSLDVNLRKVADLDLLVVTQGADGALAVDAHEDPVIAPGYEVEVADPCGAGDAFAGMFLASLVQGRPLDDALRRANALGALVTSQPGATQPVPLGEVEELVAGKTTGSE